MFDSEEVKMLSIDVLKSRLDKMGIPTTDNMSRRMHEKLYEKALLDPNKKHQLYEKLETAKKEKYYLTSKRKRSGILSLIKRHIIHLSQMIILRMKLWR
jgi:hypothetical protein